MDDIKIKDLWTFSLKKTQREGMELEETIKALASRLACGGQKAGVGQGGRVNLPPGPFMVESMREGGSIRLLRARSLETGGSKSWVPQKGAGDVKGF